tara:strand:- start:178 stop:672 length:495 start_codon:yes stop_codon:yes gene_type:complete
MREKMNVFYLHHNPKTCAKYHNDKHCVKMILEYAQLMSTAHRIIDGDDANNLVYKATHKNHPSAIWARHSDLNYDWLYKLFEELSGEYTHRYGKQHLSYTKLKDILRYPPDNITIGEFTQPTPAMPDHCKIPNDSIASYRYYYKTEKSHLAKWTDRPVPKWYKK